MMILPDELGSLFLTCACGFKFGKVVFALDFKRNVALWV